MNKSKFATAMLLVSLIMLLMTVTMFTFGQSTNRKVVVKKARIELSQVNSVDDYHESDDIIYRDLGEIQYMNTTGPVDTLYVYSITKPKVVTHQCLGTTAGGTQCKRKTAQSYCYQHVKQGVIQASK
jgi:hypothetical protein